MSTAFHISKVWSAKKNKKCLLMGRKARYPKKENRSAKWAYSSANYTFEWMSWELQHSVLLRHFGVHVFLSKKCLLSCQVSSVYQSKENIYFWQTCKNILGFENLAEISLIHITYILPFSLFCFCLDTEWFLFSQTLGVPPVFWNRKNNSYISSFPPKPRDKTACFCLFACVCTYLCDKGQVRLMRV